MEGLLNWRMLEKMTGWATSMDDESTAHWDTTADSWDRRRGFEKEFTEKQVNALNLSPEDTVLDACCGAGRLTLPIAKRVKHVTGMDAGENMLAYCAKNAREEGLTNVQTLHLNWHKSTPGIDFPKHDIVVACISPAQADIVKLSRAATKHCYSITFSRPLAYRHVMAEIFAGASDEWQGDFTEKLKKLSTTSHDNRALGFNVPFNILYDLGANPTLNYVEGGWEYEGATREDIYDYLSDFGKIIPGKEDVFRKNVDKRILELENGRVRYVTKTQMSVMGWDPNELAWDTINK